MARRPVFLNLLVIRLPVTGWVSILHRLSGALLFLAFPLGVWALSVSLSGEAGFRLVADWAAGEGAALLQELTHEVTGAGYQPPLTPAQMPGALGE